MIIQVLVVVIVIVIVIVMNKDNIASDDYHCNCHYYSTAAALASSVYSSIGVATMISIKRGAGTIMGQAYGAKDYVAVGLIFQCALILTLIISLPLLVIWLCSEPIFHVWLRQVSSFCLYCLNFFDWSRHYQYHHYYYYHY